MYNDFKYKIDVYKDSDNNLMYTIMVYSLKLYNIMGVDNTSLTRQYWIYTFLKVRTLFSPQLVQVVKKMVILHFYLKLKMPELYSNKRERLMSLSVILIPFLYMPRNSIICVNDIVFLHKLHRLSSMNTRQFLWAMVAVCRLDCQAKF